MSADPAKKPTVLFVCVHNAGRSQMAAGVPAPPRPVEPIEVRSAGSQPADTGQPGRRRGDGRGRHRHHRRSPKVLTTEAVQESDVVITMGCGDACPVFPGKRYEDWELDDPAGQGIEAVRPIRDEIRTRVAALVPSCCPPGTPTPSKSRRPVKL